MGNHVFRPLFVVIGLVALVLAARLFLVPEDFGIGQRGYMYGWHRLNNEEEWKNEVKVKYQFSNEYCKDCHEDKYKSLRQSPHAIINCENCHGPVRGHPLEPPKLSIDKTREQCLRCHFPLAYPTSGRANIRGINPEKHNPGVECAMCHNPHKPGLEGMK